MPYPHRSFWAALLSVVCLAIIITLAGGNVVSEASSALPRPTAAATSPANPQPKFQEIQMVDDHKGWAVVTIPDPSGKTATAQIYPGSFAYVEHTIDGGQTWTNVMPSTTPNYQGMGCDCSDNSFAGFFAIDANNALIATDDGRVPGNQEFYGLTIWRTRNGGRSWHKAPKALNAPAFIAFNFIDSTHGWLLTKTPGSVDQSVALDPALLYRTTDGGMTWDFIADDGVSPHAEDLTVPNPSTEPISKTGGITTDFHTGMAFESPRSGWLTVTNVDPGNGRLLHTTDGGKTWTQLALVPAPTTPHGWDYCAVGDLSIHAPGSITFLANCFDTDTSTDFLYRTSDDGKTWQNFKLPDNIYSRMTTPTNGWLVACTTTSEIVTSCTATRGAVLTIFHTSDSGMTWTKSGVIPQMLALLYAETVPEADFDFLNDHSAWLIDQTGGLLVTKDGGKTWTTLATQIGIPANLPQ